MKLAVATTSCLLLLGALAFSFVLSSHFFSNSECSCACIPLIWYTRFVVLNVFVVLPPREIDWPHALQIPNFVSSPTLKQSQIGDLFVNILSLDNESSQNSRQNSRQNDQHVAMISFAHAQLIIGHTGNKTSDTDTGGCWPISRYPISRSQYRCNLTQKPCPFTELLSMVGSCSMHLIVLEGAQRGAILTPTSTLNWMRLWKV